MTYVACLSGFLRTVPRARHELEAAFVCKPYSLPRGVLLMDKCWSH